MKLRAIIEEIKAPQGNGIIIFDIDDTLVKAKGIHIYMTKDGKDVKSYKPEDFEKLNREKLKKEGYNFDFRDFTNPKKLYSSIVKGEPLIKNLKILDAYLRAGWDVGFLTARGGEEANKKGIKDWLKYKTEDGELKKIPPNKIKFFVAVSDDKRRKEFLKKAKEGETYDAKKFFLKQIQNKYDEVKFVDDSIPNLIKARQVLPKKNVIRAQE
jgi:hypothetical protein